MSNSYRYSSDIPDDISRKLYPLSHCTSIEHTFCERTESKLREAKSLEEQPGVEDAGSNK